PPAVADTARPTILPSTTLFRSQIERAIRVGRRLHVDPDERSGGETPRRHALQVRAARRLTEIEAEVGQLERRDGPQAPLRDLVEDRKSTRLNSSHVASSYAVFC